MAISLLYAGHVSDIHINDVVPAIWAFWHSVLNDTDKLAYEIAKTSITVEEWRCQKEVFNAGNVEDP